jgi:alkanesulfonate monooxygenase SsuD/methylene tetrahydromethanopterin reductase-like flavin-dependent oxidoreductase (luciferase family)
VDASRRPALGFVVRPELSPEKLSATARSVENAGFDELWLWEDCFLAGGIAAAATALAATATIRVGLGILPAPVRNPAFAAMELAALARMHPGRLHAGFGHGVTDWMRQIGAKPESQVTLLEETVSAVRALLAGEEVHAEGRYVRLDGVRLDHPPDEPPPISCGVRRERSLAVSGRVADGTILSEGGPVEYIAWAREQIAATRQHRLTVYSWWGEDREAVYAVAAERRAEGGPHARALGDDPDWFDRVAVTGDPERCAAHIRRLADAGADAVVLVPPGPCAPPPVAALGH